MTSVFQTIEKTRETTLKFQLSPTHVAYANTLRRLCMTYVETIGFRADIKSDGATTDVEVLANSTPMTNEMLAHRIGLIPIHVPNPLEWDPERYTFVLNKINETENMMDIFASDFQVLERRGEENIPVTSSTFFKPNNVTNDTSLITVLKPLMPGGKPEELRIKAKATIGFGRENARFIPTSQCAYSYTRDMNPEHQKEVFVKWLELNKKLKVGESVEELEKDTKRKAELIREFNTLEINRCYLKNDKGEPYSFDFTIESVGVLEPEKIVLRACEKGAELCKVFSQDTLPSSVVIQRAVGRLQAWDIIIQGQDHTLGHLVQAWIDEHLIDGGDVTFVGYDIPHPLRDEMIIRIGTQTMETDADARKAFKTAMNACQAMFESWRDQWSSSVQPSARQVATSTAVGAVPKRRIVLRKP
jgi:DNA-directed RNA polymerase subunit L